MCRPFCMSGPASATAALPAQWAASRLGVTQTYLSVVCIVNVELYLSAQDARGRLLVRRGCSSLPGKCVAAIRSNSIIGT